MQKNAAQYSEVLLILMNTFVSNEHLETNFNVLFTMSALSNWESNVDKLTLERSCFFLFCNFKGGQTFNVTKQIIFHAFYCDMEVTCWGCLFWQMNLITSYDCLWDNNTSLKKQNNFFSISIFSENKVIPLRKL